MKNTKGVDGLELLQLMFIYLKLTGNIDWSWWWILMPMILISVVVFIKSLIIAVKETK